MFLLPLTQRPPEDEKKAIFLYPQLQVRSLPPRKNRRAGRELVHPKRCLPDHKEVSEGEEGRRTPLPPQFGARHQLTRRRPRRAPIGSRRHGRVTWEGKPRLSLTFAGGQPLGLVKRSVWRLCACAKAGGGARAPVAAGARGGSGSAGRGAGARGARTRRRRAVVEEGEEVPPRPAGNGAARAPLCERVGKRDQEGNVVFLRSSAPGRRGVPLREGTGRESGTGQPPPLPTSDPVLRGGSALGGQRVTAPSAASFHREGSLRTPLLLRLRPPPRPPPPSRPSRGGSPALVADAMVTGPAE